MFNFIKKIFSKKEVEPIENEPEEIIFPISLKINIDKNLVSSCHLDILGEHIFDASSASKLLASMYFQFDEKSLVGDFIYQSLVIRQSSGCKTSDMAVKMINGFKKNKSDGISPTEVFGDNRKNNQR